MSDCKGEGWGIAVQEGGLSAMGESWKERPQALLACQEFLQAQAS